MIIMFFFFVLVFIKDTLSGRKVNQNFEIKVLEVLKTYEKISIV